MKLTGWYRPDQKPVRVGWYQVRFEDFDALFFWNGCQWEILIGHEALRQDWEWRGIAK